MLVQYLSHCPPSSQQSAEANSCLGNQRQLSHSPRSGDNMGCTRPRALLAAQLDESSAAGTQVNGQALVMPLGLSQL